MTLRVGIIGAGQAGERHAVGFAATEGAKVVGIADLVEPRAAALAQQFDAQAYTDWRVMLDRGLDILVVSLPHNMHVAPTEAAAAQGVHVMMEKPIATTLADGQRIVEVCEQAGVQLSVSFVHRFREELQFARRWIDSGAIGDPLVASESMTARRGPHLPAWVSQKIPAGGGVLMYSAVHGIDRLRWLVGSEVVSVSATTHQTNPAEEVEDGVVALLTFANGASASLVSNAPVYPAGIARWETELYGTEGMLRVRTRGFAEISGNQLTQRVETADLPKSLGEHYNFVRQSQAFVAAIREEREPVITAKDGLRNLEIALAIYRSAETGQPVSLSTAKE